MGQLQHVGQMKRPTNLSVALNFHSEAKVKHCYPEIERLHTHLRHSEHEISPRSLRISRSRCRSSCASCFLPSPFGLNSILFYENYVYEGSGGEESWGLSMKEDVEQTGS